MPQIPRGGRTQNLPTPSMMGDDDRVWQCFTVDQRWVCPYCLNAFRPNSRTPHGLRSFMQQHVHQQCTAFNQGHGRRHGLTQLQHRVHYYNIEHHARNDRAWQIFDHEGYWFSPCSLQRIDSVQLINRRFDAHTVERMAEHLLHCPYYRQGIVHPVETVQQTRDNFSRIGSLARNLVRVVGQAIWQYRDAQQMWICPYCLVHLPDIPPFQAQDPGPYTQVLANHLLNQCAIYPHNPRGIRSEAVVRQAAATTNQQTAFGLGGRLPSNPALQLTPIQQDQTPVQTMSLTPAVPMPRGGGSPFHTPASGSVPLSGGFTPTGGNPTLTPSAPQPALEPARPVGPPPTGQQFIDPTNTGATRATNALQRDDTSTGVRIAQPMGTGHYRRRSSAEDLTSARIVRPGHKDGVETPHRGSSSLRPNIRIDSGEAAAARVTKGQIRVAKPIDPPSKPPPTPPQTPAQQTPPQAHQQQPPTAQPVSDGIEENPFDSDNMDDGLNWMQSDAMIPVPDEQQMLTKAQEDFPSDDLMPQDDLRSHAADSYEAEPDEADQIPALDESHIGQGAGDPDDPNTSEFAWMDLAEEKDMHRGRDSVKALRSDVLHAADVQRNLLRDCPLLPGFTFSTRFESASEISGDFYEFVELKKPRIGFALGDVSGHGMGAALIMSMAKKVFSLYARQHEDPRRVLAEVNHALADDLDGKRFITMTYAILDPTHRELTWCRAGHNPTLCFNIHTRELQQIKPPGMVVGMKQGDVFLDSLEPETTQLRSGDIFLLYTDGVTETMNRQGDEYGIDRLIQVVEDHAHRGLEHLLDRVLDSVRQFRGGGDSEDDMALLALAVD